MAIEKPSFDVISSANDVEIRLYHPAILAQTQVSGDFKQVGSDAFQKLGGYIFGQNVTDEKIAMTAPVTQTQSPDGTYLVSFFMPSKHSLDTPAQPNRCRCDDDRNARNLFCRNPVSRRMEP